MRARVRQRRRDAGTTGEDLRPAFELSWPRQSYRVLAQAEADEGRRWLARLPERRVPFFDPQPPSPPWTFVGRETPVRGLGWPPGGIIIPATPGVREDYDPLAVAADILLDVQRAVATETTDSLLHFVNRWGLLGVGIPGADDFPTDGVQRTGEGLRELARWMAVIHALQGHKPGTETWADVASVFRERLAGVHVQARVTPRSGRVACFRVPRLIDALYLELWNVATGGKRLRRCKRCEDFFVRGREDQVFCTGRCARLWHVKRWKQQQRKKRHQARHSPQQRG
jgi:hypothetical protein